MAYGENSPNRIIGILRLTRRWGRGLETIARLEQFAPAKLASEARQFTPADNERKPQRSDDDAHLGMHPPICIRARGGN